MTAKNIISYLEAKRTLEGYRHKNICVTFQSLRSQAKLFALHEIYSKAIEWYEKAFEFGLRHREFVDDLELQKMGFFTWELTYYLPKEDRNYCKSIHVARKFLKHFNKNETGLFRGGYFAWLVIREFKPIADSLSPKYQLALQKLEFEKEQYPSPFKEN